MVCNQDVGERWCVTKMCVENGVWQRRSYPRRNPKETLKETQKKPEKKPLRNPWRHPKEPLNKPQKKPLTKLCVTKLYVTKLHLTICMWQSCVWQRRRRRRTKWSTRGADLKAEPHTILRGKRYTVWHLWQQSLQARPYGPHCGRLRQVAGGCERVPTPK